MNRTDTLFVTMGNSSAAVQHGPPAPGGVAAATTGGPPRQGARGRGASGRASDISNQSMGSNVGTNQQSSPFGGLIPQQTSPFGGLLVGGAAGGGGGLPAVGGGGGGALGAGMGGFEDGSGGNRQAENGV